MTGSITAEDTLRVRAGRLVNLGHGAFVRAEEVIAVQPVRNDRGPGRRAFVWVRGIAEPFVASRSEEAILRDITRPLGAMDRVARLESLASHVADTLERIPPVLGPVIEEATGEDPRDLAAELRQYRPSA
jgi:hypothetical protein